MFALSFTALFLEMMVIRWVPSVVHLVAYYANLMLLSSFLGLGIGALTAEKKWDWFNWLPLFLALKIATLWWCRDVAVGASSGEARFFAVNLQFRNLALLVWIFAVNALVFVPIGQRMGALFAALPRLNAYGWDLAGSLGGTLCFALFSLKLFSPVLGMALVMAVLLALSGRRWIAGAVFTALIAWMTAASDRGAIWSPYYYITVNAVEPPGTATPVPPSDLRTMRDPPIYGVHVNKFGYHFDASFDPARYSPGSPALDLVGRMHAQYTLPYALTTARDRVLVVGSGGGADLEAALASGAKQVDAVEIDPAIVAMSRRFSAAAPYSDPRVTVHIDDARAYLKRAPSDYDLVVFGFLDSQALFSSMSNVRLDGYVYTVESLRTAYERLNDRGLLVLSFYLGIDWLGPKLHHMLALATGHAPTMYLFEQQMILVVSKDPTLALPAEIGRFKSSPVAMGDGEKLEPATDDWPYLYLRQKKIPNDYLAAIACLVACSVGALGWLRRGASGRDDLHFMFLGMAFLLLQTKSIGDCTLFFGATWLVTLVVVAGVLLMVLASNLVASRLKAFSYRLYLPLFVTLAVLYLVPREQILGLDFAGRLAWVLLAVPLPVFFAGLIFSTSFRETRSPAAAFGANLIGAMLGGFCEYLGMSIGSHRLSLLVFACYAGSLIALVVVRRIRGGGAAAPVVA